MSKLEYDPALLQRVPHQLGLCQRARQSLLAVDILACFHGVEHHLAMPMVGRSDDDRIHVGVGQQFPVIHVGLHVWIHAALDALLAMRAIDVTDRHDLDLRYRNDLIDEVASARPQTDAAHANRLAGGLSGEYCGSERRGGRQRRGRLACGAQKLTAVQVRVRLHGFEPFCCHVPSGTCRDMQ